MNETTRYLIMLFGVLTLLTSSYVVINIAERSDSPEPEQPAEPVDAPENTTVEEPVQDPAVNESSGSEPANISEADNIIEKSIAGYRIMIRDIKVAMGATSGQ